MNTEATLSDRIQSIQNLATLDGLLRPSIDPKDWDLMTTGQQVETLRDLILSDGLQNLDARRQAVALFFSALVYWGGVEVGKFCEATLSPKSSDALAPIPTSTVDGLLYHLAGIISKSFEMLEARG